MSDFSFDTRNFENALRQYSEESSRGNAEILNKVGRDVAYRAASFTPVATAQQISADIEAHGRLKYAMTAQYVKRKGMGTLKAPMFASAVRKFVNNRRRSGRYLRASFGAIVSKFGGSFKGVKFKGEEAFLSKATPADLNTVFSVTIAEPDQKHAEGAENIGGAALQKAVDYKTKDMAVYILRKMAQGAAQHSA